MKKKIFIAVVTALVMSAVLFIIIGCPPFVDDTVYWPDTLVFVSDNNGNVKTGNWNTDTDGTGSSLLFENDKLFRKATMKVRNRENDTLVSEEYSLVSYDAYSFMVKKDNTEYTVHFLIVGDALTVVSGSGIITHLLYFKIEE